MEVLSAVRRFFFFDMDFCPMISCTLHINFRGGKKHVGIQYPYPNNRATACNGLRIFTRFLGSRKSRRYCEIVLFTIKFEIQGDY